MMAEWKGRKEGHSHALHGDEWGEECMGHGCETKRRSIGNSMAVIC